MSNPVGEFIPLSQNAEMNNCKVRIYKQLSRIFLFFVFFFQSITQLGMESDLLAPLNINQQESPKPSRR